MIKFIGTALIMLSGLGIGYTLSANNKRHLKKVGYAEKMLCDIGLMLEFGALTFGEIVKHLKDTDSAGQLMFLDTDEQSPDLRADILDRIELNKDKFRPDEKSALRQFFTQLGTTDIEGQLSLVERSKAYFFGQLQKLREESKSKCRLYNSLGALGGAFVAIMLL